MGRGRVADSKRGLLEEQQQAGLVQNTWTIRLSGVVRGAALRGCGGGGGGSCSRRAGRTAARLGRAGRRPGVAVPGRIRMSLRAMKHAHELVVVGLAGMVQERPGTGLAGMDPAEICINMQEICRTMPEICNYLPEILESDTR